VTDENRDLQSLRLLAQRIIRAQQTETVVHELVLKNQQTLDVIDAAIRRVDRALWQVVDARRRLSAADHNAPAKRASRNHRYD
jgi:hypothetical protein